MLIKFYLLPIAELPWPGPPSGAYFCVYWDENAWEGMMFCFRISTSWEWKAFQVWLTKQDLGTSYGFFQNIRRAHPFFLHGSPPWCTSTSRTNMFCSYAYTAYTMPILSYAKNSFARPEFRSLRTGTLATQASFESKDDFVGSASHAHLTQ